MLLTACKSSEVPEVPAESEKPAAEEVQEPGTEPEPGPKEIKSLADLFEAKDGWAYNPKDKQVDVLFKQHYYTMNAPQYDFNMETLVNAGQFTGFTDGQTAMLEKNGFVVLRPSDRTPLKIHHVYEAAEYGDYPIFITADAVLNMYHIFYSESMKLNEISIYYPALVDLSDSMLKKAILAYEEADSSVKEETKMAAAYFGIAMVLLGRDRALPSDVRRIVDLEIAKIRNASTYEMSEIFGTQVDYTQYTVRGHYTIAEELEQFFLAMMWYGQSGFKVTEVENGKEVINGKEMTTSLIITDLLLSGGTGDIENWQTIYDLTSLYSGTSDDLNVMDFKEMIEKVYGEGPALVNFKDAEGQSELAVAVSKMREPQIVGKLADGSAQGKSFRLMGQRYTLDANIMQELVVPIKRPLPTAFDVLSAFGHDYAEEILREYYRPDAVWKDYNRKLLEMKAMTAGLDDSFWQKDLYHGWLWAIDSAAVSWEDNAKAPSFMRSQAWSDKSLATALGSFAELKYDNVLYSKQAIAESGGPDEHERYSYVEPNVALYEKLAWLAAYTKENLASRLGEEADLEPLVYMSEMLDLLVDCSIKELQGEDLSKAERGQLIRIGGLVDYINYHYLGELWKYNKEISDEDTSALVSDVATALGVGYLEEGIGMPYEIYAIVMVNGKKLLAKGCVYSSYEFVSKKRLTTEEWHTMLAGGDIDLLETMPWMSSYISPEANNVKVVQQEAVWENETYRIEIVATDNAGDFNGTAYGNQIRFYEKKEKGMALVYENDLSKIKPWSIEGGDLEGDGVLDLCIGAITETEFYPEEKRPFFFEWDGEKLVRKWTGSYLGFDTLETVSLQDVDGDGIDEAVTDNGVYRWGNFGFYTVE